MKNVLTLLEEAKYEDAMLPPSRELLAMTIFMVVGKGSKISNVREVNQNII